jgi:phenylacetate-CoA ligase
MGIEDTLYPLLGAYDRLPHRFKSGIGWTYRQLPRRARLGGRFAEFQALAKSAELWSVERITQYQFEQLQAVLIHAATYSPFYARRFAESGFRPDRLSSLEDMESCPFITKSDLLAHLPDMVATEPSPSARLYITTGGSTGTPVGFYLHNGVSRPKEQAFLEAQWRRGGYVDGARLVVLRGHVTSQRADGRIASYDAMRDWLMLSSYHLTAKRLPEYLNQIERFQPDVLHAYPSAALQLADLLERTGTRWPVPLRCVLAGSERLTAPQKKLLEATFKCRVYTWYGHSERVVLAGEGRTSDLLYFWPTYGYVEFGPADSQGLQEVIGTSFHNLAMPLIRYRTGDYVRLYDRDRDGPKEFDWPAVRAVEGREQEFLITATGRRISLTAVNMHDDSFADLYAVQFVQRQAGYAELRYVPGPHFNESRLDRIEATIRRKLGDDLDIELREVSEIERTPRGKGKWLVSSVTEAANQNISL